MVAQKTDRELGIALDTEKFHEWYQERTPAEVGETITELMERLERGDQQFALSFPFVLKIISRKRKVK